MITITIMMINKDKKMKKKLFLLITCFFLFSSLTIFLNHRNIQLSDRNIQLSEIIKKEEEVKKTLKELENQKEKSSTNQDEDHLDELPWLLNWKGATISLVVCGLITVPGGRAIKEKFPDNCLEIDTRGLTTPIAIDIILFIILFFIPFPFLLAIAKYKDKSYKERYCLLWRDYWKPFVCFVLNWLFFLVLFEYYDSLFVEKTNNDGNSGQ